MALPRIETSTRRIEIMPERRFAHGIWGEVGRELGQTGRTVGGALDRIGEVREREAERQRVLAERNQRALDADARRTAEYNERLAENFIANAAIGYETVDPQSGERKFVPGKLQKTRAEMKAEGTDSVKLTRGIIDEMRRESWYTSMDPAVRKHFDRQFVFTEDKWMRHAAENDVKARHAERVETMKNLIAERAKGVQSLYGMDDSAFVRGAASAAFRNMVDLEGSAIENPEIFYGMDITPENAKEAFAKIKWRGEVDEKELEKKYNRFLSGVVEFSINRVTALQKAAAQNQGLGTMDPEACLKKADDIVDALRETYFLGKNPATGKEMEVLSEDQANAIVAETERSRTHLGNIVAVETRKAREEKLREMVKSELSIRDIPQELWADAYETLGRDKVLRERAPEVAMRYLDTARDIRNAEKCAKDLEAQRAAKFATEAEKKRLESGESALKLTEARIMYLRADGSVESLRKADEMECDLFRAAQRRFAEGDITHDAYVSYMKRRKETLSMDEMRAMQKFDNAFGLDFDVASGGGVGAAERKAWLDEDGDFEVAVGDGTEEYDREEFFSFRDRFMRSMKRMKEDISRAGAVDDAIVQIKREMASGKDFKEIETLAEQIAAEAEITSRSEVMRRADENK